MVANLSNLNEIGNSSNLCYVCGIRQYWDACVTTLLKGFSGALSRNFYISPRIQTTAPSANFKKRKAEQNE